MGHEVNKMEVVMTRYEVACNNLKLAKAAFKEAHRSGDKEKIAAARAHSVQCQRSVDREMPRVTGVSALRTI